MSRTIVALNGMDLPADYFHCRYETLRKPLGFAVGSEHIADDNVAIHAWVEAANEVVAVGRAHLISAGDDGSSADHSGPNAGQCPAFTPLLGMESFPPPEQLRPAFQIRQMGTLDEQRRKGMAKDVLSNLEEAAISQWGCVSGWLQARIAAIPFYQQMGWQCFGPQYEVTGIGPHVSMYKLWR